MDASEPILESDVLIELMEIGGDDREFVLRLVETFSARTVELHDLFDRADRASDRDQIAKAAHELKSSSGQLGAMRLSTVSRELEVRAASSDDDLSSLLERLLAEIPPACAALREEAERIAKEG